MEREQDIQDRIIEDEPKNILAEILDYTREALPETEKRIEKPMRKECKVAVSIPAYEEGATILNSLENLAQQEDISFDEYEVIVNVNNRENANANTSSLNNQTLNILKFLRDEPSSVEFLSEKEREKLDKIKNSGLVLHYIDKSSRGNEIKPINDDDFIKTGCMQPRKRTMDEIAERFAGAGIENGIIASLDADTKVNPKWIKEIIQVFKNKEIELLAGERRDGLDINMEGEQLSREETMEKLLDSWNTEERRTDETFQNLPDIENRLQRAQIFLMKNIIGTYNEGRGRFRRQRENKEGVIENFKGGSGKMFRVGTYTKNPLEIIKIMDAGGNKPENINESSLKYIGRERQDKTDFKTQNPQIEALAIYPETRIRSWDVKSGEKENLTNLYEPFGSSGKEYAYAIAAVLQNDIPTTYNEDGRNITVTLENFIKNKLSIQAKQNLEKFFDPEIIYEISKITPEDLEKIKAKEQDTLEKYKDTIRKIKEFSEKPITIIKALEFYGEENPSLETSNPDTFFFHTLVNQIILSKDKEEEEIKNFLKNYYQLEENLINQIFTLQNNHELKGFYESNSSIKEFLSRIPEKVNYNEAAKKYERLTTFLNYPKREL